MLTNGVKSWESGMTVLNGDLADNYDDMTVAGRYPDWLHECMVS